MYWKLFKKYLKLKSPYGLINRSPRKKISDKLIYAWASPPDSPYHRTNPLEETKGILEAFYEADEKLFKEAVRCLVNPFGYEIVKKEIPPEEIKASVLHKELNDVSYLSIVHEEDGQITIEEAEKEIKEINEAQEVLEKRKAYLKKIIG